MAQNLERNFKHYHLLAIDALERLSKAQEATKKAPDPLTLTKMIEELELAKEGVEVAKKKLEKYAGGTIIKVTGKCWARVPKDKPSYQTSFSLYLNCPSIEDAKQVFDAQVEKDGIFMDTVSFHTIELKQLIIH